MADLSERQRYQVNDCGFGESDLEFLQLIDIADAGGRVVYQLVLRSHDDGNVYEAGTTNLVASFAQGGVNDCEEEGLEPRLEAGYAAYKPGKPGAAKAKPAKAKAAKTAAKKKPAAAAKKPAKKKK